MDNVLLIAQVELEPEFADAFETAFAEVSKQVRQEPGCIYYEGYRAEKQPEVFYFRECFADADALKAHGESPHMKAFFDQVMPWVVDGPAVDHVRSIG